MDKYGFPNPKEHEEWKAEAVKKAVAKYKDNSYGGTYTNKNTVYSYNDAIIQAYQKKIMEELHKPVLFTYERPKRKQIGLLD